VDLKFVSTAIKEILKKRFPNDLFKQEIDMPNSKRIDIACPICGDSDKDNKKKRGNIWLKSKTYKCWNCGFFSPLNKFILINTSKYNVSLANIFTSDEITTFLDESDTVTKQHDNLFNETDFYVAGDNPVVRQLKNNKIYDKLIHIGEFISKLELIPIDKLEDDSNVLKFIKKRKLDKIPIEYTSKFIFASKDDKLIYSFNLDIKTGMVIGLVARNIYYKKYIIHNYDKILEDFFNEYQDRFSEDDLIMLGNMNQYSNILNVDFTKDLYIAEGTFDYTFIYNSISLSGVNKGGDLLEKLKNYYTILDNDAIGIKNSIDFLKKGKYVFLWKDIIKVLKSKSMDYTRVSKANKIKDVNDLFCYMNDYYNIDYNKFNKDIKQYYSNSIYDISSI